MKKIELLSSSQVTPPFLFSPPAGYILVPSAKFDQLVDLTLHLGEMNHRSEQVKGFCASLLATTTLSLEEQGLLHVIQNMLEGEGGKKA